MSIFRSSFATSYSSSQGVSPMKRTSRISLIVFLLVSLSACATLFNAKTSPVQMNSNPTGADVWLDGNRMGTTPISIDLSIKSEHSLTFRMEGRDEITCLVNRKVGAGWVILDVLGGLVPVIIDAATGSWYELDKSSCNANFGGINLDTLPAKLRESYSGTY